MYGRHEDHDQGEREQQPLDQVDRHRSAVRGPAAPLLAQGLDEDLEGRAARGLDEDDVAGPEQRSKCVRRRVAIGHEEDPVGREAGATGSIGNAGCPFADDDQPVDQPGGRLPDLAMARLGGVAQLQHLAEDRDRPAGQAGQQLQRGAHRAGRGVVAVVEDRDRAGRDELAAMGRGRGPRETGHDLVDGHARGETDRRRGERVVNGMTAQGRDAGCGAAGPRRRAGRPSQPLRATPPARRERPRRSRIRR